VVSRVKNAGVEDSMVKEMVERHAHVVTAFEARMPAIALDFRAGNAADGRPGRDSRRHSGNRRLKKL